MKEHVNPLLHVEAGEVPRHIDSSPDIIQKSKQNRWKNVVIAVQSTIILVLLASAGWHGLHRHHHKNKGAREANNLPRWPDYYASCENYLNSDVDMPMSVILTADPGDFSGTSEAHFILSNLKHGVEKPRDQTVCGSFFKGELMGQPVLVITTGIGNGAAALCTLELLNACGPWVREIIYFGTSGWSPQLGGVLNPPQCDAANDNGLIARLGDVCVSPFSVNWTCKKATWEMQASGYPNQCFRPQEVASPNATILYGDCQFYSQDPTGDLALARELTSAAVSAAGRSNTPQRSTAASLHEQEYWRLMEEGTGVSYPVPEATNPPTVWDHMQCMEVDGQFFYSGVPWELKARDYAADTLNAALRLNGSEAKTAQDMIAVSAMEGIGVQEALLKYHHLSTTSRHIPFTNVRTLSNWLHQPMYQTSPGQWRIYKEVTEDFVTGYTYAIATGSSVIMSMYQARCVEGVRTGRLPRSTDCNFVVDYQPVQAVPTNAVVQAHTQYDNLQREYTQQLLQHTSEQHQQQQQQPTGDK